MPPLDDFRAFVKQDEPLAPLTWFRLGGPADWLARPRTLDEMLALLKRCRAAELPVRVLAGGSNVLVRDDGVRGVVLHLESPAFSDVIIRGNRIEAGAAVPLTALISQAARAGLAGLEILTGVPGTVGGALRGNAGGRQGSIGQFVSRATVIDDEDQIQVRARADLSFAYQWSDLDEPIILSGEFEFSRENPELVVRRMRRVWIAKRENQPYGHQSTGCIFKNPSPETSAGMIVEHAGLKGTRVGGAEVSDRHGNFIVAHPGATVGDVLTLIDRVRDQVRQRFGLDLELQIQIW